MNRPYVIICTLVVFVSSPTAARNYLKNLLIRDFRIPCKTSDVVSGECVPYDECRRYDSVHPDINDFKEIRPQDGPCLSSSDVCCLLDDIIINPIDSEPIPRGGWCGWRNPQSIGYQTTRNNRTAKFGEFPWTVAVLKADREDQNDPSSYKNLYLGVGSLIHPSVVLTAAHIVRGESLMVRAGDWDTQTEKEVYPHQDRNVWKTVIHKDFNNRNFFYDVALLFLENSIKMAPNVGTVCLPPAGQRAVAGSKCFASGWGMDIFAENEQYQAIMRKVEVPVIDRNVCQNNLRSTRLGRFFELHTSFMCAGGEFGVDTCVGDGGSPLVCPIEFETDRYMQSGIVAWDLDCSHVGWPGVYVDVAGLREWVDSEVGEKGLSTDFYTFNE